MPCAAHRLNLVLGDTAKSSVRAVHFFVLLKDFTHYYRHLREDGIYFLNIAINGQ